MSKQIVSLSARLPFFYPFLLYNCLPTWKRRGSENPFTTSKAFISKKLSKRCKIGSRHFLF